MKPCSPFRRILLVAPAVEHASEPCAEVRSIFWTTSKRACSIRYVCFLRHQHGPDCGILPQPDSHRFELALFRLSTLPPTAFQRVLADNKVLEAIAWCAEQSPRHNSNFIDLFIVFSEDFGVTCKPVRLLFGVYVKSSCSTVSMKLSEVLFFWASSVRLITDDQWASSRTFRHSLKISSPVGPF